MAAPRRVWWARLPDDRVRLGRSGRDDRRPAARRQSSSTGRICRVGTDATIAEGMLATVIARLPDDLDIRILPIQAVGKSNEHLYAPGTLTLPATTLIEAWTELGALGRARRRAQARVRQFTWRQRGDHGHRRARAAGARGMLPSRPAGRASAAGRACSRVGAALRHPWRRHRDVADAAFPARPGRHGRWRRISRPASPRAKRSSSCCGPTGTHAFAWIATDLNPAGVVGEAALATAEKGRATAEFQADGFIRLLRDVRKARLADWLSEM